MALTVGTGITVDESMRATTMAQDICVGPYHAYDSPTPDLIVHKVIQQIGVQVQVEYTYNGETRDVYTPWGRRWYIQRHAYIIDELGLH